MRSCMTRYAVGAPGCDLPISDVGHVPATRPASPLGRRGNLHEIYLGCYAMFVKFLGCYDVEEKMA